MNLVKQLGSLAFGTRLRLLTDKFIQDGDKVYRLQNVDFEARWFTMYYLLSREDSPLSISEITAELGYTQPAVTQIANIMLKKGIIKVVKNKNDTRRKMLTLSPKGLSILPALKPIWKGFEDAVNEIFNSAGYDVISVIEKIENELEKKDLLSRVQDKIKQGQSNSVNIINYSKDYKDSFRDLNY
jgi:DNA-binding MarR family transcriptional regulator